MTKSKRVALVPPLPGPKPVAEHLSMLDEAPALPKTRGLKKTRLAPVAARPTTDQGDSRG
jgi:hypothetical protein